MSSMRALLCPLVAIITLSGQVVSKTVSSKTVSLVIPCSYQHAPCLYDLLTMYQQQTVLPDEVIIALSQSKNVDPLILQQLENESWPFPVSLLLSEEINFAGQNRNRACSAATGDIFVLQDADDSVHPQRIEIIKQCFEQYPIDFLIHSYVENEQDAFPCYDVQNLCLLQKNRKNECAIALHYGNIAIARKVFEKIQWTDKARGQDVQFCHAVQAAGFECCILPLSLMYYRPSLSAMRVLRDNTPLCSVYTPDSVLNHKEKYHYLYVGNRTRYSTCTGVVWLDDTHLAALNLFGGTIDTYSFDPLTETFSIQQRVSNKDGAQLFHPENLIVSPDGSLLAVCSDSPYPGVRIYTVDTSTHMIDPKPIVSLSAAQLVHNIRFTCDGRYMAWASFAGKESVCVYEVIRNNGAVNFQRVYTKVNSDPLMKAKGIHFTHDNTFVVVAYSRALGKGKIDPKELKGMLICYSFDHRKGIVGNMVSQIKINEICMEDIALVANDSRIIASNQVNDTLAVFPFNPQTGKIDDDSTIIGNPEAQLSFPHGLAVSPNGNYLAVTNYGDDKFNLYRVR